MILNFNPVDVFFRVTTEESVYNSDECKQCDDTLFKVNCSDRCFCSKLYKIYQDKGMIIFPVKPGDVLYYLDPYENYVFPVYVTGVAFVNNKYYITSKDFELLDLESDDLFLTEVDANEAIIRKLGVVYRERKQNKEVQNE